MRPTIVIGAVAAFLLVLAACGSGDSVGTQESAPPTSPTGVISVGDPLCGEELVVGDTVTFTPCPDEPGETVPTVVEPVPGQSNLHPVVIESFELDETLTSLTVTWWSLGAPCAVLDHVEVAIDGGQLITTVFEGSSPAAETQPCGEMAVWKATVVALPRPADGMVLVDGGAVELGDPPLVEGNVTLYVSNQSFEIDPVDITITIDGRVVVEDDFLVLGQHNWIEYPLEYPEGTYELVARSEVGDTELVAEFTVDDRLYMVVDFWSDNSENLEPEFSFYASEDPIGFA